MLLVFTTIPSETFVEHAARLPAEGFNKKTWKRLGFKDRVNKHVRDLVKSKFDLDYVDHTVYQWDFVPELETSN